MKRILITAAIGVALAASTGARRAETIQLVYHSDTRGWYSPCG